MAGRVGGVIQAGPDLSSGPPPASTPFGAPSVTFETDALPARGVVRGTVRHPRSTVRRLHRGVHAHLPGERGRANLRQGLGACAGRASVRPPRPGLESRGWNRDRPCPGARGARLAGLHLLAPAGPHSVARDAPPFRTPARSHPRTLIAVPRARAPGERARTCRPHPHT